MIAVVVVIAPIPLVAVVALAPVASPLEIVARLTRRVAVAAEAIYHVIEVPLSVIDTVAAVLPTLGLGRLAGHHSAAHQQ
jgi:hypothetical protein